MKLLPVQNFKTNYTVQKAQNLSFSAPFKKDSVNFKGENYPSGYYTDREIEFAKKHVDDDNWREEYWDLRRFEIERPISDKINNFAHGTPAQSAVAMVIITLTLPVSVPAIIGIGLIEEKDVKKQFEEDLERMEALMTDVWEQRAQEEIKKQQEALRSKQYEEMAYRKDLELKENIEANFLGNFETEERYKNIPSFMIISSGHKNQRKEIIDYIKESVRANTLNIKLNKKDSDKTALIKKEIQKALENQAPCVLFIENFDNIINDKTACEEMKEIIAQIDNSGAPLSVVIDTNRLKTLNQIFDFQNNQNIYNLDLYSIGI